MHAACMEIDTHAACVHHACTVPHDCWCVLHCFAYAALFCACCMPVAHAACLSRVLYACCVCRMPAACDCADGMFTCLHVYMFTCLHVYWAFGVKPSKKKRPTHPVLRLQLDPLAQCVALSCVHCRLACLHVWFCLEFWWRIRDLGLSQ